MVKRTVKHSDLPVKTQAVIDDFRAKLSERRYVKICIQDGRMVEEEFSSSVPFPSGPHSRIYVLADDTVNRPRLRAEVEGLLRSYSEPTRKSKPVLSVVPPHPDVEFLEALCDPEKADKYLDKGGVEQRPGPPKLKPPAFKPPGFKPKSN